MAASGSLGFDGKGWPWEQPLKMIGLLDPALFTVVSKTFTYNRNPGNLKWYNPFGSVRLIHNGVINAISLSNPGIDWFRRKIGPKIRRAKIPIIVSIASDKIDEIESMAELLNAFDLVGIELDDSCANIAGGCNTNADETVKKCEALYEKSDFPIILKLSITHPINEIIPRIEGIVQAISINSVPWSIVFPNQMSPLAHLGGGAASGKIIQPFTWNFAKELVNITKIPIIGPSVWEFSDIEKLRGIGAKAISFGSIFLPYPWRPTMYVKKDMKKNKKP